jgi:threonine synthase
MNNIKGFDCFTCAARHGRSQAVYACPSCGGNLQVLYDYPKIRRTLTRKHLAASKDFSLWRYEALLPVEGRRFAPSVSVGWTPLYDAPRLARKLGVRQVWLKDDGRSASASLKDRASAVVVARALEARQKIIAVASTGNAAASLACLTAGTPAKAVIFVPKTAPPAKLAQLMIFGATVVTVDGSYDDAFDLCLEACRAYGWYNRSTGFNPFTREGKKTAAFELCEQTNWKLPDWVFVPVGDGNIISGIWKGLREFHELGLIDRLPRLAAAQAAGSDSVAQALASDGLLRPSPAKTIADSVAVRLPKDGAAAVRAVRDSRGAAVTVSDAAILSAMREVGQEGVFAEPAAALAYAALRKAALDGLVRSRESAVVLITGNGLKDAGAARLAAGTPVCIKPKMSALRALVKKGILN